MSRGVYLQALQYPRVAVCQSGAIGRFGSELHVASPYAAPQALAVEPQDYLLSAFLGAAAR